MNLNLTLVQEAYDYDDETEGSGDGGLDFYEIQIFSWTTWVAMIRLLIALLGLVGNSVVLWLLGFRIQRSPFSVYILNLAAADALFLCEACLISLTELFSFSSLHYKNLVFLFPTYTFYTVGLSLLAAISTERCLSVLFPIWYRCHRPKDTSSMVCAALWALGGLLSVFVVLFVYVWKRGRYSCHLLGRVIPLLYFTLLTGVLCVSSLTLLLRIQCSSQRRQPPRLHLLVLLTVLVFLLCGLAPGIGMATGFFGKYVMPFQIPWLLAYVNSSANPLIYFFLGSQRQKRREPLRVLLQRVLTDDQEMRRESRNIPCTDTLETSS